MKRGIGTALAAVWIFGTAAYYYVRFTLTFVADNREAIAAAFERLAGLVGLG